jgi:hypothetical protein
MRASYGAAEHAVAEEIDRRFTVTGTARWNDVVGRTGRGGGAGPGCCRPRRERGQMQRGLVDEQRGLS